MNDFSVYDVRCQPGDSAFLIDDSVTSVLYDTGFGFTGFKVAENIKKILGDRKLDYIFLTHSHYDHALGSPYILRYYPDAKVVAGKYAANVFARPGAKALMRDMDAKFAEKCGVSEYEFLGDELRVDIPVSEGDVISTGDMTFEVVELPGHTKCSVGYYCKEYSLLLSSETLGVYDGEDVIVPSYLVGYNDSLRSIDKMLTYDIKRIVAPHFGLLDAKQTQYFLSNAKRCSVEAADFIFAELQNGTPDEDIVEKFKQRYRHGYISQIYPEDAINLNTTIMIELLKKELFI